MKLNTRPFWLKMTNCWKHTMCGISEPVYKSEKYLKIKIKSYDRKINTSFHDNSVPKESSHRVGLSVTLIDSIFKMAKNHYKHLWKTLNMLPKRIKMTKFNNELEISSDDSDDEVSDKKMSDEE